MGIDKKLSNENITTLYDLCRYFWSGIENKFSPWCAIFTTGDLKVLEYIEDLEHYYKYGYGSPITELLAQVPMTDLFNNFQSAKEGKGKKFVAYFSDSPMINMACTALKLYKDKDPLTGSRRDPKRKWRTSTLSAFSANLVAVLNRYIDNELLLLLYSEHYLLGKQASSYLFQAHIKYPKLNGLSLITARQK